VVLIREPDRDVLIKGGVRAVGDVTLDEEWQTELVRAAAAGEAVVVEEGREERPTLLGLLAKLAAWRCTCDRCERLVREVGGALGVTRGIPSLSPIWTAAWCWEGGRLEGWGCE